MKTLKKILKFKIILFPDNTFFDLEDSVLVTIVLTLLIYFI